MLDDERPKAYNERDLKLTIELIFIIWTRR
jgi:hypothetical protein